MGKWLTKAKHALGKSRQPEIIEPIELMCECGVPIKGIRSAESQRLICSKCGTKLYVLPKSRYPIPDSIIELNLQGMDAPALMESSRGPALPRTKEPSRKSDTKAMPPRVGSRPAKTPDKSVKPGNPTKETPQAQGIVVRERSNWGTPLKLTAGLIGIVLIATVMFVWRSASRSSAERRFQIASVAGQEALDQSQLASAKSHFADALAAADYLGRDDLESRRVHQLSHETAALDNLLTASFDELIQSATKYLGDGKDDEWNQLFGTRYGGYWMIFDTVVVRLADEDDKPIYEWQHPLQIGTIPFRMTGGVDALSEHFPKLPPLQGQRVVIAVQPDQLRLVPAIEPYWELRFNATSGFLWANPETLAIRWGDSILEERELRDVLRQQNQLLGLDGQRTDEMAEVNTDEL